jgi:hypothetical protein
LKVWQKPPNGAREWQVGRLRVGVETGKTQSQENAQKTRRVPTCPLHYYPSDLLGRIVSPLISGCAMTIFFSFFVVAKSLSTNIYRNQSRRADRTEQQSIGFHSELFLIM